MKRHARPHKFNVAAKEDRTWNGVPYDSKAEMIRAQLLTMLINAGQILGVKYAETGTVAPALISAIIDYVDGIGAKANA